MRSRTPHVVLTTGASDRQSGATSDAEYNKHDKLQRNWAPPRTKRRFLMRLRRWLCSRRVLCGFLVVFAQFLAGYLFIKFCFHPILEYVCRDRAFLNGLKIGTTPRVLYRAQELNSSRLDISTASVWVSNYRPSKLANLVSSDSWPGCGTNYQNSDHWPEPNFLLSTRNWCSSRTEIMLSWTTGMKEHCQVLTTPTFQTACSKWYYITFIFSGQQVSLYLDGVLVANHSAHSSSTEMGTRPVPFLGKGRWLEFGQRGGVNPYWVNGAVLASLAVWDRPLAPEQVGVARAWTKALGRYLPRALEGHGAAPPEALFFSLMGVGGEAAPGWAAAAGAAAAGGGREEEEGGYHYAAEGGFVDGGLVFVKRRPADPAWAAKGQGAEGGAAAAAAAASAAAAARRRAAAVRRALGRAWAGYRARAWGRDELRLCQGYPAETLAMLYNMFYCPLASSCVWGGGDGGQGRGSDRWGGMAMTMLDSLDSLWLMDFKDEFWEAVDWIHQHLDFDKVHKEVSTFETAIRALGGLQAAAALSGEGGLRARARDLGRRLGRALGTPSGIFAAHVDLSGRIAPHWKSNSSVVSIAAVALQPEFRFLAASSSIGDAAPSPDLLQLEVKAMDILRHFWNADTWDGLPRGHAVRYRPLGEERGLRYAGRYVTLGAHGDSYVEYLLKTWLLGCRREAWLRGMYDGAVGGLRRQLLRRSSRSGLTYLAHAKLTGPLKRNIGHRMEHLGCFVPGMLMLGAATDPEGPESKRAQLDRAAARKLAYTCHQMYRRQNTGLAPEAVHFNPKDSTRDWYIEPEDRYYILRPETVESLYYLYYYTRDPLFQDWAWEIFQAIEAHCGTAGGYAPRPDVRHPTQAPRGPMESFFLAETLKYLWLIFQPEDRLLDPAKYIFTTEAHPLPVLGEERCDALGIARGGQDRPRVSTGKYLAGGQHVALEQIRGVLEGGARKRGGNATASAT